MPSTFSFEAGRRCDSGEGSFEFETQRGNFLFQAVESAINRQRISFPQRQTSYQAGPEAAEDPPLVPSRTAPLPQLLPLPHAEPDSAVPPPAPPPVPPQDPGYSLPFDTIGAPSVILGQRAEPGPDPLYDSIDEMKIRNVFPSGDAGAANRKLEHIYDEPESCAAPAVPASLYDDPEEVRGDAWRVMGTEADPKGHEYPYNPCVDDYAVPKRAKRALLAARSTNEEGKEEDGEGEQEEEKEGEEDSPYTNVMVKIP
uniref:IRS-type PTB domain-containing protein n=1 Tax=Gasterosteus aculeatus aculeatus TaxID=481459 RepID=A0AAQ4RIQ8_GASAC